MFENTLNFFGKVWKSHTLLNLLKLALEFFTHIATSKPCDLKQHETWLTQARHLCVKPCPWCRWQLWEGPGFGRLTWLFMVICKWGGLHFSQIFFWVSGRDVNFACWWFGLFGLFDPLFRLVLKSFGHCGPLIPPARARHLVRRCAHADHWFRVSFGHDPQKKMQEGLHFSHFHIETSSKNPRGRCMDSNVWAPAMALSLIATLALGKHLFSLLFLVIFQGFIKVLVYFRNTTAAHSVSCVWQEAWPFLHGVHCVCCLWCLDLFLGLETQLSLRAFPKWSTLSTPKLIKTSDIWTNYDVMTGEPDPIALLQRNSSLDSLMFFLGFFLGEHSLTIPVVSDAEDRPFVGALKAEAVDGLAGNFSRVDQRKIKRWKIVESFWF